MKITTVLPALSLIGAAFSQALDVSVKPPAPVVPTNKTLNVEGWFTAECKTCPFLGCANKVNYDSSSPVNVTCWTFGTSVNNNTLVLPFMLFSYFRLIFLRVWLKTAEGCYVTEWGFQERGNCMC